jgi:hypothetical protein
VNKKYFSILNSFDSKKLIINFCLINLLIISLIPLSFKRYQIYMLDCMNIYFTSMINKVLEMDVLTLELN